MKTINLRNVIISILLFLSTLSLRAQEFPEHLEFIFLVDVSGSMEFSLNGLNVSTFDGSQQGPGFLGSPGDHPHPETPAAHTEYDPNASWQRLWYIRNVLPILGDIIENIPIVGTGTDPDATVLDRKYGFGIFPGNSELFSWLTTNGSGDNLVAWSQEQYNNIVNTLLTPRWNGTPIGTALNAANSEWPALSRNLGRILYLLTDGSLHGGDPIPFTSPPSYFKILSFGLGERGVYETNFTDLELFSHYFGQLNTHKEISPTNEVKNFTTNQVDGFFGLLDYPIVSDPAFVMTSDSLKKFKIEVTEFDKQLYFITSWHEPKDSNKVVFTLETPHRTITPDDAAGLIDVVYSEGSTYLMYVINPTFLKDHLGTWQLKIDGSSLLPGEEQITDYLVGGPSSLKAEATANTSGTLVFTGDSLIYTFKVRTEEDILKDVEMEIKITTPSIAPGNWFAENKLSEFEMKELDNIQFPGFATKAFKKSYYIRKFKQVKAPVPVTSSIKLKDDGKHGDGDALDGIYGAVLTNISHPGLYRSRLLVEGKTLNGQDFTRELRQTHIVEPKISGDWKHSEFKANLLKVSEGTKVYQIKFIPKDPFGNYLMPGQAKDINIEIVGKGGLLGKLEDDLQGGYIQKVWTPDDVSAPVVITSYKDIRFPARSIEDGFECIKLELAPFVSNFYLDDKLNINDALTYGLKLRTCISPTVDLEAEIGITPTKDTLDIEGHIIKVNGNILFKLATSGAFKPYISVGGGFFSFNDFSKEYTGGSVNFAGGVRIRPSKQFSFIVEGKDHILFDAFGTGTTHNFQATVGLMFVLIK